jgi:DNA-binding transcriptional LysR family regulator
VDIREVEAFLAVAEELHFGRAADRLHVTPTRVSQNIRSLERRVGARLFERSTRRVGLTPLGERLLADLRPAYLAMETALSSARDAATQHAKLVRVAFATTISRVVSGELVDAFQQREPECQVVRTSLPTAALHAKPVPDLGRLDLFITWAPGGPGVLQAPGWTVGPVLATVPRALLIARGHPFAARTTVDIEELADLPLLRMESTEPASDRMAGYVDAWVPSHTPAGRPLNRIRHLQSPYIEELMTTVTQGWLAHLTVQGLTDIYQHQDVASVPLTGLPPVPIAAAWPAGNRNPMVKVFIEAGVASRG